jgi:23S rRNA pseudouridine2605 synthase
VKSETPAARLVRLNKFLADHGVASRRKADELIASGQVTIDGEIVTELGRKVDPALERVEVDGVVLRPEGERHRYYLLNKPPGVICTNDARESRTRAVDLIQDRNKGRIYTVGRLDEESSGLVLLTNDGEFANRVSHPRYGVAKTYRVVVAGRVDEEVLRKLRAGVRLSDFRSSFARISLHKRSEKQSILFVTMQEGKNREVRRVFAHLGLPVRRLQRVRIGNLDDRGLKVGSWRPLTKVEVQSLLHKTVVPPERPLRSPRRRAARPTAQRAQGSEQAPPPTAGRRARRGAGRGRSV